MRTEGATAEVFSKADRLALHRQIHEVQVVNERREEHADGKEEAHRVSPQTLFGGAAHLHQRVERSHQQAAHQRNDNSLDIEILGDFAVFLRIGAVGERIDDDRRQHQSDAGEDQKRIALRVDDVVPDDAND